MLGYAENNYVQGFTVLKSDQNKLFLEYFKDQLQIISGDSTKLEQKSDIEKYKNKLNVLLRKGTDTKVVTKGRAEQKLLSQFLFSGRETETCSICNLEYPVEFLHTAHVKVRSKCTNLERIDLENIVMPACIFGCDALYEKGFIVVRNGLIEKNKKSAVRHLDIFIDKLIGNQCLHWNEDSKKYFKEHYDFHSKVAE